MAKVIYGKSRLLLTVAELREVLAELECSRIMDCTAFKECWDWYKQKEKEAKAHGDEGNEG